MVSSGLSNAGAAASRWLHRLCPPWVLRLLVVANLVLLAALGLAETVSVAFQSEDPLIYALVGEGIYARGLLPYSYVFDHKPVLLYFFYGPLAFLDRSLNVFTLVTAVSLLVMAGVVRALFTGARWPLPGLVAALGGAQIGTIGFSGNSEMVFVPFQLLAIGLLLAPGGGAWRIWASAAAAIVAVNCNYLAAVGLVPALLYALWARSAGTGGAVRAVLAYAAIGAGGLVALFAVLALAGMDVVGYFGLQYAFLTGYAETDGSAIRPFLVRLAPFAVLAAPALIPGLAATRADRHRITALAILIVATLAGIALTGKYYTHYIFAAAVPAVIIFLLARAENLVHRLASAALLGLTALYYLVSLPDTLTSTWTDGIATAYDPIAKIAGDAPVMSMNAAIVPLYVSGVRPYQPVVWRAHMSILRGPDGADAAYTDLIAQGPPFVMTREAWCDRGGAGWTACDRLAEGYTIVAERDQTPGVPGFTLWQRGTAAE